MDRKFFLYTQLTICFMWIILLLCGCSNSTHNGNKTTAKQDQKIIYLNSDSTAYTKGDTITLDGRKFIKVWGITHCKYNCPVLIECK